MSTDQETTLAKLTGTSISSPAKRTNHARMPSPTPASAQPPPIHSSSKPLNPEYLQRSSSSPPQLSPSKGNSEQSGQQTEKSNTASSQLVKEPMGGDVEELGDAKDAIEPFEWNDLEERFWREMEECRKVEKEIEEDFAELLEVCNAWTAAGAIGEEERARKRLRTRMAFVQQREQSLEEKRLHYIKVVKAFESALALLGGA